MSNRRISYKTPRIALRGISQEIRRKNALADQKLRRAHRIDSSRNLDLFSNLSIGDSDEGEDGPQPEGIAGYASLLSPSLAQSTDPDISLVESMARSRKPKEKRRFKAYKLSKFANRCMYAELLEIADEETTDVATNGLPQDLQTAWIALAPIPIGKRCLAVCYQANGLPGTVRNTALKSRLKGSTILTFPSPLPGDSIIDCILDSNWQQNGILHVLDVLRWKGQEIGDCEARFRFWWRDMRFAELAPVPPPSSSFLAPPSFPYPITLQPIPYHADLSWTNLLSTIIPLSRSIQVHTVTAHQTTTGQNMMVDGDSSAKASMEVHVKSDGLLLYVSEASYDSGSSPLSTWIPSGEVEGACLLDIFESIVQRRMLMDSVAGQGMEE